MDKNIPKIKVIHKKTKTVHYARYALRAPEPLCYTAIGSNKNYVFTDQPVTCKCCQQYFADRAQVVEGYWTEQIEKALKIRKTHECPFELFANKYGYNLKYDRLVFSNLAPEFLRRRLDYYGLPYHGWERQHAIDVGGLPKNVSIGTVWSKTNEIFDKVLLIHFAQYNGLLVNWELIKK